MKLSTLATAAALFTALAAGSAQAAIIIDLDATKGSGTEGSAVDAATKSVKLEAGSYSLAVIDNTAKGGYAGYNYNSGPSFREAFDFSLDNGVTTYSVDVTNASGKFTSYDTTKDGIDAFASASSFSIYSQNGAAYDASVYKSVNSLDFTLARETTILFGIPDNRFGDNKQGVSLAITAAVPEPETYAMMLAGLGALGVVSRRRKSA